ncbi:MAG: phosphoribosylformimino-5-aminoimidazole carboxamide ribotide isomerase [ANME-2 cluster archaeon]|nr:phosphoribosylformimino-5-aminoimidazole carboxamide ribotide isomerase [ANME-2 cluster archaeon]
MFRVIFVLDILDGQVVHAVKGERENYGPIHTFSKVCESSDPLDIINELVPGEVYIADLNRLGNRGNNDEVVKQIGWKSKTMLDLGASSLDDVHLGHQLADSIVLGTETATHELLESATGFYPRSINMSIDIKGGRILTREPAFNLPPLELIQMLNNYDINDLIILELSKVGTSSGINTGFLEQMVDHSDHNILLGGGVRGKDDINLLRDVGLEGVLVATAVHSGALPLDLIQ